MLIVQHENFALDIKELAERVFSEWYSRICNPNGNDQLESATSYLQCFLTCADFTRGTTTSSCVSERQNVNLPSVIHRKCGTGLHICVSVCRFIRDCAHERQSECARKHTKHIHNNIRLKKKSANLIAFLPYTNINDHMYRLDRKDFLSSSCCFAHHF